MREANMKIADSLKVYVADRSPAVLERLTAMLAQIPEVKVVGQVSNLGGVLDAFVQLDPEVVIIDAHLPGGIEVLKTIKREKPATVVVMLTDLDYPQYRHRFHSAGANNVLDISNEFLRLEKLVVKLAEEHRGDGHKRSQAQIGST
jgi:DNA-binding NarL/FixJ family response regulator